MTNDTVTEQIIGSAIKVHSAIGAGCLESTYHVCLAYQLRLDGLQCEHQVRLPITYKDVKLEAGYRIDFLVENCVIVELKAVEKLLPLHLAQVMTYLKLSGHHVGLLINFNVPHLRHGIRRVVNNYQETT
jgi:GxxExxY protein